MSLEQFLESLTGDSTDLSQSDFIEVSDLMPEELGQFVRTWFTIPVERKRWTISTMVELTEDNPELDFSAVFKLCLKEHDETVLENAMEGLWEHEDRSVINGLINVLHSSNSPRVRAAAAVALGKFPVLVQEGKILAKRRRRYPEQSDEGAGRPGPTRRSGAAELGKRSRLSIPSGYGTWWTSLTRVTTCN